MERAKEMPKLNIKTIQLKTNPKYDSKSPWGTRPISYIEKIIVHQAMADATTEAVHRYHTGSNSHLKSGGAPRIAYHYTIEKDGTVYKVNELRDITWHCRGQNIGSIGILILGNFDGPKHRGTSKPTPKQIRSLGLLLDHLREELKLSSRDVYGHSHFGKMDCPGIDLVRAINLYRGRNSESSIS